MLTLHLGVPKQSGLMTDAERVICARLKQFREAGRWPRNIFAAKLGITDAKLVSIENGFTPLRYNLAWRVATRFGLNLRWLATAREPQKPAVTIPNEIEFNLPQGGLFSMVYAEALSTYFEGASQFLKTIDELRVQMDALCAGRIPDENSEATRAFVIAHPEWLPAMKQRLELLRAYGRTISRKVKQLQGEIAESEHFHKTHPEEYPPQTVQIEISRSIESQRNLTSAAASVTTQPMPSWSELKARVRRVSEPRGVKTALADVCGVTRQAVATWLDADSTTEPGAEATLRLLEWVTAEEAKKSTPKKPVKK